MCKLILLLIVFFSVFNVFSQKKSKKKKPKETTAQVREGFDKLVDIQVIDPTIKIDLKYASSDNFMKKKLYFDINKLYLQKEVALRLSLAQKYLKSLHPTYSLLVYDGARPLSVQQAMWDALDSIPVRERTKFVSNPASGSVHNYAAAVDLTICDAKGEPLDMGAGYDDIRRIAYPRFEAEFLKSKQLTQTHISNRELLRMVMKSQKFVNIATEWWHFNAFSIKEVRKKYAILK
jgi:D-alanyl-D-alanine dipeptidase